MDMQIEQPHWAIAAIGASAGGITALQSFFRALPAQPNLTLVIIQHLLAGRPSSLTELIAGWTSMPVRQVVDGVAPQRSVVYVVSPDDVATLERGVFRTQPAQGGCHRPGIATIDAFFESLATERGGSAIGVVLTGTGTDGAAGALSIKQAGGIVLVQDPATAIYDGMPLAAIGCEAADHILPIGALADEVVKAASPDYVRPHSPAAWTHGIGATLDKITGLIRSQAGFDLSGYKTTALLWRIQQRMDIRRVRSLQDYEALLRDDPAELETLIRTIPIHVTEFFRDPEAWEALEKDVLSELVSDSNRRSPIRAWTPACATGEEAYSLAMLVSEAAERANNGLDFQLFATDASPEILARASRGVFSEAAIKSLPSERKARFFYTADGGARVKRNLREKMAFAPQDLVADPPLTDLDLVTCRNLLIYLNPQTAERVLNLLHSALRIGGYLFLGKGETLSPHQAGFEVVSGPWRIYRKTGPISEISLQFPTRPEQIRNATAVPASAHRAVAERLNVPSVLIDDQFQILRVYGENELLRVPAGEPTHNLLDIARPEFVPDLKQAAEDALADHRSVTVSGLADRETGELTLNLRLTPLQTGEHGGSPRLLVSLTRNTEPPGTRQPVQNGEGPCITPGTEEDERAWTETMRISHQELEASREELQVLNEELKATNDQLNISNEDLNRANTQLQEKINELEMQSRVLSSGAITTLFLDEQLRAGSHRRFAICFLCSPRIRGAASPILFRSSMIRTSSATLAR
jgi:two-component system CheB/CheR fusion protein